MANNYIKNWPDFCTQFVLLYILQPIGVYFLLKTIFLFAKRIVLFLTLHRISTLCLMVIEFEKQTVKNLHQILLELEELEDNMNEEIKNISVTGINKDELHIQENALKICNKYLSRVNKLSITVNSLRNYPGVDTHVLFQVDSGVDYYRRYIPLLENFYFESIKLREKFFESIDNEFQLN